jgi:hypothetical protein
MLVRTADNIRALTQMRRQTLERRSDPLPLPPLVVKKRRPAKLPEAPAPPRPPDAVNESESMPAAHLISSADCDEQRDVQNMDRAESTTNQQTEQQ